MLERICETYSTEARTPSVHMSVEYDIGANVRTSAEQYSIVEKRTRTVRFGSTR